MHDLRSWNSGCWKEDETHKSNLGDLWEKDIFGGNKYNLTKVEYARCVLLLVKFKENDNEIADAAKILQEV